MNDQPLVSVIVPTYNYGCFIEETLECLRAQTYVNWECIVVDDGSTDDTAERVSHFMERDARFKFLRQENARQAAAKEERKVEAKTGSELKKGEKRFEERSRSSDGKSAATKQH